MPAGTVFRMDVPLYGSLQTKRREILARLAAMTPEVRAHATGSDWSPVQILEHLNVVDGITLNETSVRPGRGSRHIFLPLLMRAMRKGRTLPAPGMSQPRGESSYDELVAQSEANHRLLGELVASATERDVVSRHPMLGPLTATQACDLLDSHYDYHLKRFPTSR